MKKFKWLFLVIIILFFANFWLSSHKISDPRIKEKSSVIKLPKPDYSKGVSVEEAIMSRRSVREFSNKPLKVEQLSELLFASYGITGKEIHQMLRSAPSAGTLYPFDIFVVINNVKEIQPGIYLYDAFTHSIKSIKKGNFGKRISEAALGQEFLESAAVVFVLSAVPDRMTNRYGERGWRYIYMEAGHISQNIYLEAVSLKLGSVSVGAFIDEEIDGLFGFDGIKEKVLYLHAVGDIQ